MDFDDFTHGPWVLKEIGVRVKFSILRTAKLLKIFLVVCAGQSDNVDREFEFLSKIMFANNLKSTDWWVIYCLLIMTKLQYISICTIDNF